MCVCSASEQEVDRERGEIKSKRNDTKRRATNEEEPRKTRREREQGKSRFVQSTTLLAFFCFSWNSMLRRMKQEKRRTKVRDGLRETRRS